MLPSHWWHLVSKSAALNSKETTLANYNELQSSFTLEHILKVVHRFACKWSPNMLKIGPLLSCKKGIFHSIFMLRLAKLNYQHHEFPMTSLAGLVSEKEQSLNQEVTSVPDWCFLEVHVYLSLLSADLHPVLNSKNLLPVSIIIIIHYKEATFYSLVS